MMRIAILGSTGSIGSQTLEVIRAHPERLKVVALAAYQNTEKLALQASGFGMDALLEMATSEEVDLVVISVSGMIGLQPTLEALRAGKKIALASKEVLVAGGAVVMPLLKRHQKNQKVDGSTWQLRPIDSEHAAILQCLQGERLDHIKRLILTASGGPFRGYRLPQLHDVTPAQALDHPTWKMGGKITIDSATLMNKGLELIEACWLFGVSPDLVEIVVHPQSVIHSMVQFNDDSVIAQMGHPDMTLPIQYAILGPDRLPSPARHWSPLDSPHLTFEGLDHKAFPAPDFAREALRKGGVVPAYMNATNEEAANAFLNDKIPFMAILKSVEESLKRAPNAQPSLENILTAAREARKWFRKQYLFL
jgi:1-deoxy-D-xylulose-5-phosphate reductoisomerase